MTSVSCEGAFWGSAFGEWNSSGGRDLSRSLSPTSHFRANQKLKHIAEGVIQMPLQH